MLYKILDWTTNHVHLANDLIMYNVLTHTRSFPPMPIQSLRLHQVSYRQSILIIWTRTRSIRSMPSPTTSSPRRLSLRVARKLQQPRTRQRRALNEQHTTMALFPACPFATCGERIYVLIHKYNTIIHNWRRTDSIDHQLLSWLIEYVVGICFFFSYSLVYMSHVTCHSSSDHND